MTAFWDPNFTPPCGQLAAPYLSAHREPGPNSRLYTQIQNQVRPPILWAIGLALAGRATRGNDANLVILAS